MIFKPEMVEKILAGEKTVTRRPAKTQMGDLVTATTRPEAQAACRYEVGKTYAVQPGRGKKGVARIRVLDVDRYELDLIGDIDAAREGFGGWEEFRDYWRALYGSYDPTQLVDRIEFELVEATPERAA